MSENQRPLLKIGVLALQGAFAEHVQMLRALGAMAFEVRKSEQIDLADGLVIPGGESTTMGLVAERWALVEPLRCWVHEGKPTWGTCAGMILLAEHANGQKQGGQPLIGGLDVSLDRNYFGRQVDSFETLLSTPGLGPEFGLEPCRAIFIRAPAITQVGPDVEVLAELPGPPPVHVAVRQHMVLATAFHPELTSDTRWHRYFLSMVAEHLVASQEASVAEEYT